MSLHFLFQLTNVSNPSLGGNDFARYCQESDELWNIHRILYRNFWPCSKLCKYNKYNLFMLSFSRPSIFNILFQRRFLSAFIDLLYRLSIIRTLYSTHTIAIVFVHTSHLLHISPYTFFAYIQRARNIFSSLMMPLIGESLDLSFYLLKT